MLKRRTIEDICQEAINRLRASKTRCVDVETSGLSFLRNHIVGYVLTFGPAPSDTYYLPFRHAPGGNIGGQPGPQTATGWDGTTHPAEDEIIELLDQPGTLMFGHNIQFDLKFMACAGLTGMNARFEDTQINAPLLDEYQPYYSLEYCARTAKVAAKLSKEVVEYLRSKFPEIKTDKEAMGHFWRLSGDDHMAVDYASGDGTSTWQLRDWQMPQLAEQGLLKVHDVESRLIPILARMSLRGIRVDLERFERLEVFVKDEIERLMNAFPSGFNAKSPNDVRAWMEKHGCTDWPLTPKGAPSMRQEWLETHDAGQQIMTVRKLRTLQATFMNPLRERHLWNGRVHTTYNQLRGDEFGTITGRLSCVDPNLQAVPKHDEFIGRLFRDIYVPDYDLWGAADYAQIEPKLLAVYSRARALLAGFRADPPIDAHTSASIAMQGQARWDAMSPKEQKQYRNDYGKRINQTLITGGGAGVLVTKYKMDPLTVKKAMRDYFRALPEIKFLQKTSTRIMETRGHVTSLLGRRARYDGERGYVGVNRLLQCGNADILKDRMVAIDEYIASEGIDDRFNMLNNCHDAFDFQFYDDPEGRKHWAECLRIMTDIGPGTGNFEMIDVPITVDAGEGPTWAIATYGEAK